MHNFLFAGILLCSSITVHGGDSAEYLTGKTRMNRHKATYITSGQLYQDGKAGKFKLLVASERIEATISAVNTEDNFTNFTISDEDGKEIGGGHCYIEEEFPVRLHFNYEHYVDGALQVCNLRFSLGQRKIEMSKIFRIERDNDKLLVISGEISGQDYLEWEVYTAAGKKSIGDCTKDDEYVVCPPGPFDGDHDL